MESKKGRRKEGGKRSEQRRGNIKDKRRKERSEEYEKSVR